MITAEEDARAEAGRFREEHGLGAQPIGDLITVIEQTTGVDVAVVDSDSDSDQHGMTMRDPDLNAVFIAVARTPHPMRQRSSLAHELAHVLFGDGQVDHRGRWADRPPSEIRADAFARHLLVPRDGLTAMFGERRDLGEADLSAVVQRFLVSPRLAAIALYQSGRITESAKTHWDMTTGTLAARHGWIDQYHALQAESCHLRAPQRLLTRAIHGYQEGVVSAQAIAQLRGLDAQTVEGELRDAGIAPGDFPISWAEDTDLPPVDDDLSDLDDIGQGAGV